MAIGVAQNVANPDPLVSGGSGTTVTCTITCAANSILFALAQGFGSSATLTNITDDQGGSVAGGQWTILDSITTSPFPVFSAWRTSTPAGAMVVTFTFSVALTWKGAVIQEITGAKAAGPIAHTAQDQTGVGTGTDAITTGNMTIPGGTGPCIVVAFDYNVASPGAATSTAGTGFTSANQYWVAASGAVRPEWQRVTSTGTVAATWTGSATSEWRNFGAVFEEATASSGTIAPADGARNATPRAQRGQQADPLPAALKSPWSPSQSSPPPAPRRYQGESTNPIPPAKASPWSPSWSSPPPVLRRQEGASSSPIPPLQVVAALPFAPASQAEPPRLRRPQASASADPIPPVRPGPPIFNQIAAPVVRWINRAFLALGLPQLIPVIPRAPGILLVVVDDVELTLAVDDVELFVAADDVELIIVGDQ